MCGVRKLHGIKTINVSNKKTIKRQQNDGRTTTKMTAKR